jgi:hypothetical protein
MHDQKLVVFAFMAVFVSYCPLFWCSGDLHGPWHLVHIWEAWPKTHCFCVLGSFSWAIAHCFGFPMWLTRPMTLTKCLRGMTKNSSFVRFWDVLWAIVHSFGFPGWFRRPMTLSTCLTGMTKKSSFLRLWPFLWATHCFGVMGGLHGPWNSVHVWEAWSKTCRFYIFGPFSWAIVHSFGFSGWFSSPWHLVLVWYAWPKTRRFCVYSRFCELLPTVWGSGGFTWPVTLSTCLRGMTKNLSFLHFRAVFVSYSPQFWVFGVIFKPMTLSTFLICMTKNSSFLHLWPFLWPIVHCLGFWGIYMVHDT